MSRGAIATVLGSALLAACASFTVTGGEDDAPSGAWVGGATPALEGADSSAGTLSEDDGGDARPDSSTDAAVDEAGPALVDCTNERCKQTIIVCPEGRDCIVSCSGNDSCGHVMCPTGHACRIECMTGSTCGSLNVLAGMTNAARVCVRCIGQGSCGFLACDVRRTDGTDAPCSLDCADGACGPGVDRCDVARCAREACDL